MIHKAVPGENGRTNSLCKLEICHMLFMCRISDSLGILPEQQSQTKPSSLSDDQFRTVTQKL